MRPYADLGDLRRRIIWTLFPIVFGFVCLVYGFYFALTAPYMTVPFAAPIALLALLSIWALPNRAHAPTKSMELFFAGMVVSLILWPNYLALALPGLPWITAIRLTGTPMALLFLTSLSVSEPFRREVREVVTAIPSLWIWYSAFILMQALTLPAAVNFSMSTQKFIIQLVNWSIFAVVGGWVMRKPGRVERYLIIVLLTAVPMFLIAQEEFSMRRLLWLGHIPSFLKIDDPIAGAIFASIFRPGSHVYRAKAVFSTPLGLSEFTALLTPFAIHFALGNYAKPLRIYAMLLVPAIFYTVRLTDGRLGVIGFIVSVLLYLLFWGMMRFKRNRRDLIAATLVYGYPSLFAMAMLAVEGIHSVKVLVFGGGSTVASNLARHHQLVMGLPKVMTNPLGHGAGGGGAVMGYGAGQFIAIDNYYLALGLDYGVIGLASFIGLFLLTIGWSVRTALVMADSKDREFSLLIPLAVCLSAFLVIKIVFAQQDLHAILFMMVGAASALVYRAKVEAKTQLSIPAPAKPAPAPRAIKPAKARERLPLAAKVKANRGSVV